ncbi:hypothetical protein F4781DRAFT_389930 [Annulohypoxylon bovei var. microspora]|nr:hypothetical protein F4781DRAFT_389930 [Annulohypoxylon bovei var. microspora]
MSKWEMYFNVLGIMMSTRDVRHTRFGPRARKDYEVQTPRTRMAIGWLAAVGLLEVFLGTVMYVCRVWDMCKSSPWYIQVGGVYCVALSDVILRRRKGCG